jgi:hypothetical protein
MSLGLATKGMISFGGGGGAGEPYPVYRDVHYDVDVAIEDELEVILEVEDITQIELAVDDPESISIEVEDISIAIDATDDEVDIEVE